MLINSGHIISEKKFDDADKKKKRYKLRMSKENKSYKFAKTFIQNVKIFIKWWKNVNFINESKSIFYCVKILITKNCGRHCGNRLKVWKTSIWMGIRTCGKVIKKRLANYKMFNIQYVE